MKQITILGVTGLVGKNLLQKAIKNGMKVKVLVRNKEKLQYYNQVIEVIEGNYFDEDKLQNALQGSETILSTIGPPMNDKLFSVDEDKYIKALTFIIKQMHANKQTRWISISGVGIKMEHENLPLARKLLRVSLKAKSKSMINIKDRELQLLKHSNLNWTCVRSPVIKEKAYGEFYANESKFLASVVDLNQLTDFMISEITNMNWIEKAPVVGTK